MMATGQRRVLSPVAPRRKSALVVQAPAVAAAHAPAVVAAPAAVVAKPAAAAVRPAVAGLPAAVAAQQSTAAPVASPSGQNAATIKKIMDLLKDTAGLKTTVMRLFKSLAAGKETLDVQGLARFKVVLVQVLGVPGQVFGDDVMTDYVRFDFDGNGRLEVNEVYKLVKFNLWEHVKALGGTPTQVSVPFRTLEQAGYTTSRELGEGSQAVVKLARDSAGRERCIKCYKKGSMSVGGLEELKDEFEAMRLLGCQSLAQTFEVFQDSSFYYMVNEVYYGGDLGTLRQRAQAQGVNMNEDWWRKLFRQCLRALEFMHQQAMIHCDIKEPNVMLKTEDYNNPEVVVVDFGLSKAMGAGETGICGGTPGYIPPETLKTRKWFPGGDVFSLGVVIFQMMTNATPDPKVRTRVHTKGLFLEGCATFQDMCQATMTRQPPFHRMPAEFPGLTDLTKQLLQKELPQRPRAPQALEHQWIVAASALDDGSRLSARRSSPLVSQHPLATQGITPALLENFMRESDKSGAPPPSKGGLSKLSPVAEAASVGASAQASLPPSVPPSAGVSIQQAPPVMQDSTIHTGPATPSPPPQDMPVLGQRLSVAQAAPPVVRQSPVTVVPSRGVGGLSIDKSVGALVADAAPARQQPTRTVVGQAVPVQVQQAPPPVVQPAALTAAARRPSLVMPAPSGHTATAAHLGVQRQQSGAKAVQQPMVVQAAPSAVAYPAAAAPVGGRPLEQVRVRQMPVQRR